MRYTQSEKLEIIRLVETSDLPIKTTLLQLQVSRASFYRWYRAYVDHGAEGLDPKPTSRRQFWNKIPDQERERVVEVALARPELSARELAFHITDHEGWFIALASIRHRSQVGRVGLYQQPVFSNGNDRLVVGP